MNPTREQSHKIFIVPARRVEMTSRYIIWFNKNFVDICYIKTYAYQVAKENMKPSTLQYTKRDPRDTMGWPKRAMEAVCSGVELHIIFLPSRIGLFNGSEEPTNPTSPSDVAAVATAVHRDFHPASQLEQRRVSNIEV